jgi:hypothetical protein
MVRSCTKESGMTTPMLRDLEREPHLWVWALPRITGVDPVAAEDAGKIERMSAWLRWGREKGYRW